MIRRGFRQFIMQELADRNRIGAPRGNRPLAGQVFEKSHPQHLQVNRRINPGPSYSALIVGRSAKFANLGGKSEAFQSLLQLGVEPTLGACDHLIGGFPKFRLPSFLFRDELEIQTPRQTDYSNYS